jgi:hypothetical protein
MIIGGSILSNNQITMNAGMRHVWPNFLMRQMFAVLVAPCYSKHQVQSETRQCARIPSLIVGKMLAGET